MSFFDQQLDSSDDEDGSSFFRHSDRNFDAIVAEQQRRRAEQKEAEEKAKLDVQSAIDQSRKREIEHNEEDDEQDNTKKRRSSHSTHHSPELHQLGGHDHTADTNQHGHILATSSGNGSARALKTRSVQDQGNESPQKASSTRDVIELDDQGDNIEVLEPGATTSTIIAEPAESDIEESDEELADIIRQARRKHKLKKSTQEKQTNPKAVAEVQQSSLALNGNNCNAALAEPVIELFITSYLPNTNPVRMRVRLSQQLSIVRKAWCTKHGLNDETTNTVYLVYRLRRLYDVSTCRSLGFDVDSNGALIMKGASRQEGVGRVHLQAVTDDIFAQLKSGTLSADGPRPRQSIENTTTQGEEVVPDTLSDNVPRQRSVNLVLRTKNRADFKLMAKPGTSMGKIVAAYKKVNHIDANQRLSLSFDGEILPASTFVRDTELTDLDIVDVIFE